MGGNAPFPRPPAQTNSVCFLDFLCQFFTFWKIKSKAVIIYQTSKWDFISTELEIFAKESNLSNQILLIRSHCPVKFDFLRKTGIDLPHCFIVSLRHFFLENWISGRTWIFLAGSDYCDLFLLQKSATRLLWSSI